MPRPTIIITCLFFLALAGCAPPKVKDLAPANKQTEDPKAKLVMPKVKYPAAVIFEGGRGNPWMDSDGTKHKASWRLYLCLKKTDKPVTEQVEIDFSKLGNAIEVTWQDGSTKKPLHTDRLNSVTLNYTYTTEVNEFSSSGYAYAYSGAASTGQSQQNWETIFSAPDYKPGPYAPKNDRDLFNLNFSKGILMNFGLINYKSNGEDYYLSNNLVFFTFDEKAGLSQVVEACEREDKPYFFQIGDELTPLANSNE